MVSIARKLSTSTRPLISQNMLMVGLKTVILVHLCRSDTFQLFRLGTSLSLIKNISEVFIVIVVKARQSWREIGRSLAPVALPGVEQSHSVRAEQCSLWSKTTNHVARGIYRGEGEKLAAPGLSSHTHYLRAVLHSKKWCW